MKLVHYNHLRNTTKMVFLLLNLIYYQYGKEEQNIGENA